MYVTLNTEVGVTDFEIERALAESWPHVSEVRKDSGFTTQLGLQKTAIRKNAINFFDDSGGSGSLYYCGSISLGENQIEINSVRYWVMNLVLIGSNSNGDKSWFFNFLAGTANASYGDALLKLYPFNTVTFVQPTSPVGKALLKAATESGAEILTYSDCLTDDLHPSGTALIRRVHTKPDVPSVYVLAA